MNFTVQLPINANIALVPDDSFKLDPISYKCYDISLVHPYSSMVTVVGTML